MTPYYIYPLIIVLLFIAMIFYIRLAEKLSIVDQPNERSSHNYCTVRGGGVVWWLAGVICSLLYLPESICFLIGITLISIVSFWDDIASLPNKIRIVVHFMAVTILFFGLGFFQVFPWLQILVAYIIVAGILNAYNFMDGINGITGLYSLSILIALQYVNSRMIDFTPPDFIIYAILACIVFLFFNYRKQARCFAGDIGSMAVSFWIVYLLLRLMLETQSLIWIFFLTVYGVDTVCTILHRLYLRQDIFKAHRMHFYQVLSNEKKISHLIVSAGYALLQLVICVVIVVVYQCCQPVVWIAGIGMTLICGIAYLLKFNLKTKNLLMA